MINIYLNTEYYRIFPNIDQFNKINLDRVANIGITASASAPEILVQNFIQHMNNVKVQKRKEQIHILFLNQMLQPTLLTE